MKFNPRTHHLHSNPTPLTTGHIDTRNEPPYILLLSLTCVSFSVFILWWRYANFDGLSNMKQRCFLMVYKAFFVRVTAFTFSFSLTLFFSFSSFLCFQVLVLFRAYRLCVIGHSSAGETSTSAPEGAAQLNFHQHRLFRQPETQNHMSQETTPPLQHTRRPTLLP